MTPSKERIKQKIEDAERIIEEFDELIKQESAIEYVNTQFAKTELREIWSMLMEYRGLIGLKYWHDWTPVSEGVPDTTDDSWVQTRGRYYSEPVLVTYASLPDGEPMVDELAQYRDDGKWYWYSEDANEECRVPILAWQELPEPYVEYGKYEEDEEVDEDGDKWETFTDIEQRIFLAAMSREERACKEIEKLDLGDEYGESLIDLVAVCHSIERKVRHSQLWRDKQ